MAVAAVLAGPSTAVATTFNWTAPISGLFSDPANWSTGVVPNSPTADAIIDATGAPYVVQMNSGVSYQFNSLTVNSSDAQVMLGSPVNASLIQLQAGYLDISSATVSQTTIAGGTLSISGVLNNTGTISLDQGILEFLGPTDASLIGTIARTGGTVYIASTFTVPGGTLDMTSIFGGNFTLSGSTDASVINGAPGSFLTIAPLPGDLHLHASFTSPAVVTFHTDVNVSTPVTPGSLTMANGFSLGGHNMTVRGGVNIALGTGGISGTGNVIFQGTGSSFDITSVNTQTTSSFIVASGITLRTDPAFSFSNVNLGNSASPFVNNGLISSEASTGEFTIFSSSFLNTGTINISAGTVIISGSSNTSGLGTIVHSGGQFELYNFTLNNTDSVLTLDNLQKTWNFDSGVITGGTINLAGGALAFAVAGAQGTRTMDGVTLLGNAAGTKLNGVTVVNGLTLSNLVIPGSLTFAGNQTLGGVGTLTQGSSTLSTGTLTIGPQITLQNVSLDGSQVPQGSARLQGSMTIAGQTIQLNGAAIYNEGNISVSTGGFLTATNLNNSGVLNLSSAVLVTFDSLTNSGTITSSHTPLRLSGTLDAGTMSVLNSTVEILSGHTCAFNSGQLILTNTALEVEGTLTGTGLTKMTGSVIGLTAPLLSSPLELHGTVTLESSGNNVINSLISGDALFNLNLATKQVIIFGGQNQFAGFTGTFQNQNPSVIRLVGRDFNNIPYDHRMDDTILPVSGTVTLADGGTQTIGGISSVPGSGLMVTGSDQPGSAVPNTTLILGNNTTDATYWGTIADGFDGTSPHPLSLLKTGSNVQTLYSALSFTGFLKINGGTLSISTLNAATSDAANLVLDGGALDVMNFTATDRLFTIGAGGATIVSDSSGILFSNTGTLAFDLPNSPRTLTLTAHSYNGTSSFAPRIIDNGSAPTTLVENGIYTWLITGTANAYSGGTFLNGGFMQFAANALPGPESIHFGGGAISYIATNLEDYSPTFSNAPGQAYAVDTGNFSVSFATPLTSPGGSFTKKGSGTLTFNVVNSYTGATTVLGGLLRAGIGNAIPSGPIVVNGSNAVLDLNNFAQNTSGVTVDGGGMILGGTLTSSGSYEMKSGTVNTVLGGSGAALNKTTTGTVILSGVNTYSGPTSLLAGVLQLNASSAIPAASQIFFGGGTLRFAGNGGSVLTLPASSGAPGQAFIFDVAGQAIIVPDALVSVGGSLTKLGAGNLILEAKNTYDGATTITAGTLAYLTNDAIFTGPVSVMGSTSLLDLNNYTDTVGQVTLDNGALIANGTLTSTVSFELKSGTVTSVLAGATTPLNKTTTGTVILAGHDNYGGATSLTSGVLQVANSGALGSTNAITFGGGTLQFSAANTVDYSPIISNAPGQLINLDTNGQTVAFNTALVSSGGTLTKTGAGTLVLNAPAGVSATSIRGGTLRFGTDNAVTTGITLVSSGALDLGGHFAAIGDLVTGTGTVVANGTLSSATVFSLQGGTVSANLTGAAAVNASASTTLSGDNSWAGRTNVQSTLTLGSAGALGSSGAIFMGGVLRFSATNTTDYSARLTTDPAQQFGFDTNGMSVTLNNPLSSSGNSSLTVIGAGTLTTLANNFYQSTTIQSGATLSVGNGGSTGTLGSGTVTNNGTLIFNESVPLNFSSNFFGNGTLIQQGSNTVTVTANPFTYTGSIAISNGVLKFGTGGAITWSSGTGPFVNNAGLVFASSSSLAVANPISGSGYLQQSGTGVLALTGANVYSGSTVISSGTIQVSSSTALGTGPVFNNGTLVVVGSAAISLALPITGSGTFTQQSTGTTTLSGANSFGSVKINAGVLTLGSSGALGDTGPITFGGGTLQFSSANTTDYSARFTTTASQSFNLATNGQVVTLNTPIVSAGGGITKSGSGTLVLNAANVFAGVIVTGGTIQEGTDNPINHGSLQLNTSTAIFDLNNHVDMFSLVALTAGSIIGGTLTTTSSGFSVLSGTVSASLAGNTNLTKTQTGTVVLSGANTYGGTTTLTAGVLQVAGPSPLPAATIVNFSGGVLQYSASNNIDYSGLFNPLTTFTQNYNIDTNGQVVTFATPMNSTNGNLSKNGAGTLVLAAHNGFTSFTTINAGNLQLGIDNALSSPSLNLNGPTAVFDINNHAQSFSTITLTSGSIIGGTLTGGSVVLSSGSISASLGGSLAVIKSSTGTVTLSGNNTYTGSTSINAGVLEVGSAGALSTSTISFNGGTLRYVNGNTTDYSGQFSQARNQVFSIDTNGLSISFGNSPFGTPVDLTKIGAGTLTLTGVSSVGNTSVNGGILRLGANNSQFSSLNINTSSVFDLNGYSCAVGEISLNGGSITGGTMTATSFSGFQVGSGSSDAVFAGTKSLIKYNATTVTLSGNNTYTGGTTISGGVLVLAGPNAIGTSGTITFTGGTLQYTAANTTDYSARFSKADSQLYSIDTNGQSVVFGTALTSSPGTFTKVGTGTLTLNAANTFTGATTVSGGVLRYGINDALGTGAVNVIGNTSVLDLNSHFDTVGTVTLDSGGSIAGGTLTSTATYQLKSGTVSAVLAGGAALAKSTTGTVTLAAATTFTGSASISGGVLTLADPSGAATKYTSLSISKGTVNNYIAALNISDNKVILRGTSAADKATKFTFAIAAIKSGFANGTWLGNGITSSTAAADPADLAVGLYDNAILGKTDFGGTGNVDSNSVLLTTALIGDTNLDGHVDATDLDTIVAHWKQAVNGWTLGDLNFDGMVDNLDVALVVNHWDADSSFLPLVSYTPGFTFELTAIPEPGSLAIMALGAALIRPRRRR